MRRNDSSIHHEHWTNRKLFSEARKYANLESFATGRFDGQEPLTFKPGWDSQTKGPAVDDFCREQTRLYRDTYLNPILDEIERRFVK